MYLAYFGLTEAPFSITPDPGFIYLSGRHRDALAHLLYGVGQGGAGGFVQLTGEVGTGKTTLCRALLEQVPEGTHIALVLNPLLNPLEMLAAICEELGIATHDILDSGKALVDRLTACLLEVRQAGERVVLVIDEAQNLSPESLEQVRLLTNLETSKEKLLQIILLGQPELRDLLRRRDLRQLAQRITARYHLTPLNAEDTRRYIGHRLAVAGAPRNPFNRSGMRAIFQRSQGVPRLINIIADRALVAAYATEAHVIGARLVNDAANEVQLGEPSVRVHPWIRYGAAALVGLVLAAGLYLTVSRLMTNAPPASASVAAAGVVPDPVATETRLDQGLAAAQTQPAKDSAVQPQSAPDLPQTLAPETGVLTPALNVAPDAAWFEQQNLRAWQGLANAWGKEGDAAMLEASCRGRDGLGFACLRDQGNWLRIRELGLPVVLELVGDTPGYLLLRGLQDEQLLVGAGDSARIVSRAVIDDRWFGAYHVAWPQAANWPREIERGDEGEAVDTVLQMAVRATPAYTGPLSFGREFELWLTRFQQDNGLDMDGIVGPKTLLYLMRFSIEEPRLATALEQGS